MSSDVEPHLDELEEALAKLRGGDAAGAFLVLRPRLAYGALDVEDALAWVPAVELFSRVASALVDADLGERVRACVAGDEPQALFDLGFQLVEQGLPDVAATFLARANLIAPGQEAIVAELASALEQSGRDAEACKVLRAAPEILAASFGLRYLLAFNAMTSGDVDEAERTARTLTEPQDANERHFKVTIDGMLARHAAAKAAGAPLDADDLRGWTWVIDGALLLHVSPHGPEVMRGRYAWVQDGPGVCREAIEKLRALVTARAVEVPRVFALPSRGGEILARAAAEALAVPLAPWPSTEPGLLVAYDVGDLDEPALKSAMEHRPGQLLWVHASCWTEPFAYAPDLVTFLYQQNVAPWGEQLRVDPETQKPARGEADTRAPEAIAGDLLAAPHEDGALADVPAILALARATLGGGDHAPGLARRSGVRRRLWAVSPVKSASFL